MAANSNNAPAAKVLDKSYPPGIIVKVSLFVRHIVCKTPLDLGFYDLAYEVMKSMIRGLVSGFCVNKYDCTKVGRYKNNLSLSRTNIEELL